MKDWNYFITVEIRKAYLYFHVTEFTNIAKATVLFPKTADSFITHGSFTVSERASIALHWKQEHGRKLRKLGKDSKHTKPFTYATQGRSTCEEAILCFFLAQTIYIVYTYLCARRIIKEIAIISLIGHPGQGQGILLLDRKSSSAATRPSGVFLVKEQQECSNLH